MYINRRKRPISLRFCGDTTLNNQGLKLILTLKVNLYVDLGW